MKCNVCKKKEVKFFMPGNGSYPPEWGFCSKVCIANNSIRHYKMIKANK